MKTRRLLIFTLALVAAQAGAQQPAPGFVDAMRGPVPITGTTPPPPLVSLTMWSPAKTLCSRCTLARICSPFLRTIWQTLGSAGLPPRQPCA